MRRICTFDIGVIRGLAVTRNLYALPSWLPRLFTRRCLILIATGESGFASKAILLGDGDYC